MITTREMETLTAPTRDSELKDKDFAARMRWNRRRAEIARQKQEELNALQAKTRRES